MGARVAPARSARDAINVVAVTRPGGKDRVVDQVASVVRLTAEVVGPDLLGAYLHGSSVLGGLRPASDVDILAVTRRSLGPDRRRALVAGLLPISGATVVVQSEVRPWRY